MMTSKLDAEVLDDGRTITLDALKLRLSAQLAPRRWRSSFEALSNQVAGGQALDVVIEQQRQSLPAELRCLVDEALRVPDPTKLLLDALRARQETNRGWRELLSLLAYPSLLFGLALLTGVAFSFAMRRTIDFSWISEFGLAGTERILVAIDDQHHALLGLAMAAGWLVIVMGTMAIVAPRWALLSVASGLLLVGRPLRWISLQEILLRFELFIGQGLTSLAAAEAVSRSFNQSSQAVVAAAIARRIGRGTSLGQSLCLSMLSDGLCRPALRLLDLRGSDMRPALAETSELLGRLSEQRCRALSMVLPVCLLLLVGTIVWASLCTYLLSFLPLISMITSLA